MSATAGGVARCALIYAAFTAFTAAACSPAPGAASSCFSTVEQRLVNGAPQESYLGLAAIQTAAIVKVVSQGQPYGPLCSGTFISPNWVVTARHCLQIPSPQIVVQGEAADPLAVFPVIGTVAHPNVDVALLNVDTSSSDAGSDGGLSDVAPIVAAFPNSVPLAPGDVVEVAGYGVTEDGTVRSLRFLAESIASVNDIAITVSGMGNSGACEGDSGGPLLVREPDGSPAIAGVMSFGSATCLDSDVYVRLDVLQEWVAATVDVYSPTERPCGQIAAQGRCLYGSALWCAGTQLSATSCAEGTQCGWDSGQKGFRCVDPKADPCDGIDSLGTCVGDAALWCSGGMIQRYPCAPCEICRVDGKTGGPTCVPRSD